MNIGHKKQREELYNLSVNYIQNNRTKFIKNGQLTIPYYIRITDINGGVKLEMKFLVTNSVFFRKELFNIINNSNYVGLIINNRLNIKYCWMNN